MAEKSHNSNPAAPRPPPAPPSQPQGANPSRAEQQQRAAGEQRPAPEGDGVSFVKIPKHRPFERCPLASKYERVNKVGEGTFG
jgi:hypothetical protein